MYLHWQMVLQQTLNETSLPENRVLIVLFLFSAVVGVNTAWCCVSVCVLQSKSSIEQMESQSADAEPPPPPKPELRYPGLPRAETEGETHALAHNTYVNLCSNGYITWHVHILSVDHQVQHRGCKGFTWTVGSLFCNLFLLVSCHSESSLLTEAPTTPSMYKYRPPYNSPGRNHTALTHPNKVYVNIHTLKYSPTIIQYCVLRVLKEHRVS